MADKEEGTGTIESIVLVTIPAALVYFIGWAYLHYYLSAFSIDLSELEFDLEGVLIYAAPPIVSMCTDHQLAAALLLLAMAAASLWLVRLVHRRHRNQKLAGALSYPGNPHPAAAHPLLHLPSFVLKGLWALVTMVCLVTLLRPALRDIAIARAQAAWDMNGVAIRAIVEQPEKDDPSYLLYAGYQTCMAARRLHLVFSDRNRYFMLCKGDPDFGSAALYEVRREDSALASVRYISRPR